MGEDFIALKICIFKALLLSATDAQITQAIVTRCTIALKHDICVH